MSLRHAAAAVVLFAAASAAHAQFVINEGFDNVANLGSRGWVLSNASSPLGSTGWFQGDQTIFTSQAGAPQAYVAANFNNAAAGGTLANWLISPTFSTQDPGYVRFYARADVVPEFSDQLVWGFSHGGSSFADFTLGAPHTIGAGWTQFQINFAAQGVGSTGRFAIVYTGPADLANYVGVDTFAVAVPEPETWALMIAGLAGLAVLKRRRAVRA